MFQVTGTIKKNMKKITDLDLQKEEAFSQNIPDMKEYFKLTKIRMDQIEEVKNANEDLIIKKCRSKIQTFACNSFFYTLK